MIAAMMLATAVVYAQSLVSTAPQKRNALIEEYTGVGCQYCPLGHKAVDEVSATYPGRVFAINIHQGTFASRYTTQWGNALAQQSGVTSYPSATLNRHVFKNSIQIAPAENYMYVPQVLEMDAPVNAAAVVDIDVATRLMTVRVEAYYTANSDADFNLLNVALLQSNVYGTQSGGSTYYPENMVNGQYHHKHILRHLLTGQWGDTIRQTTAGSLFSKEYAYVIPYSIGDLNISDFDDLSVVVFVTRDHKEVLNATEAIRTGDKARMTHCGVDREGCSYDVQPFATVVNPTAYPISNMRFSVDGTEMVCNKSIAPYHTDTVHLPLYRLDPLPETHQHYSASRTVGFVGYSANGQQASLGDQQKSFTIADFDLYTTAGPLTLTIRYDNFPTEVSFSLFGYSDCNYYYRNTGLASQTNQQASYTLSPANAGVYRLRLMDVGGDGLNGTVSVSDAAGNTLFSRNAADLSTWDCYFNITTAGSDAPIVGIESAFRGEVNVYPNPVLDWLTVDADGLRGAELYDLQGHLLSSTRTDGGAPLLMSTDGCKAGIYLLRIVTDAGVATRRVVIVGK